MSSVEDKGSPQWIKPCERLRLMKKARRQLQMTGGAVLQKIDTNTDVIKNNVTHPNKISHERNPFRISPRKQNVVGNEENNPIPQSNIFKWMTKLKSQRNSQKQLALYESYLPSLAQNLSPVPADILDDSANLCSPGQNEQPLQTVSESKVLGKPDIPVDWSLKQRVRFTSINPFPWRGSLKTAEEASGTTSYARCLQQEKKGKKCLDSTPGAQFYQQCLYWVHPSLPWLQLFPRLDRKAHLKKTVQATTTLNENVIQEALHADWCESLRSLYQLLRARQCPYFYVCASTFTVLFRAAGINGISEINAMLTPTTRGMRQAFIEEDINFTMPLKERKKCEDANIDMCSQTSCTSEESLISGDSGFLDEENSDSGSEEPGTWLESLGLSQSDFPSLSPKKMKLNKEKGKSVDHHPQSLVYIQGVDTQAFLDFLLNTKLCCTKTGPLTGVPPTLISPTAFHGGSLRLLKIRQGSVKHKEKTHYMIELTGPITPSAIRGLCLLFNLTQNKNYTASFITHQPTAAFCSVVPPVQSMAPSAFAVENLKDCGLSKDMLGWMCTIESAAKTAIDRIIASEGLYIAK